MRVYELAKELNVSIRDILYALCKQGIEGKSNLSALSAETIDRLRRIFASEPIPVEEIPLQEKMWPWRKILKYVLIGILAIAALLIGSLLPLIVKVFGDYLYEALLAPTSAKGWIP